MPALSVSNANPPKAFQTRANPHPRAFESVEREHGYEAMEVVEGAIPPALDGVLYGNGPGLNGLFGEKYHHWFDGDGAVTAIRFAGGAEASVRVVQTRGLLEERRHGKMRYAGYHRAPSGRIMLRHPLKRSKNSANTSVLFHDGRLFALWEGGPPTELDPETLETWGTTHLGGIRNTFSAHPSQTPSGRLINFGVQALPRPCLEIYAVDGVARKINTTPLPFTTVIHDFIVTERFAIFFVSPVRLRRFRALFGIGGLSDNLEWKPELGTEVQIVPLDGGPSRRFSTEPFYQWHFSRAEEVGDEVHIDFVRYPDFDSNAYLGRVFRGEPSTDAALPGSLWRAVLNASRETASFEPLSEAPCEFPVHAFGSTYAAAHKDITEYRRSILPTRLIRMEGGHTHMHDLGGFLGEPTPVECADGRFILVDCYDADRHQSQLLILDEELAFVARLAWPSHLPPRFHHGFVAR